MYDLQFHSDSAKSTSQRAAIAKHKGKNKRAEKLSARAKIHETRANEIKQYQKNITRGQEAVLKSAKKDGFDIAYKNVLRSPYTKAEVVTAAMGNTILVGSVQGHKFYAADKKKVK